jgi:AAA+ superfamily predicted ATPase
MYFYRVEAGFKNYTDEKLERRFSHTIRDLVELHCLHNDNNVYVFVNSLGCNRIIFGVASTTDDISEKVYDYAKLAELEIEITSIEEVTLEIMRTMLRSGYNSGYVFDSDSLFSSMNIGDISKSRYGVQYSEFLINDEPDFLNSDTMDSFAAKKLLAEELERVNTPPTAVVNSIHPVHYIINTDTMSVANEADKILVHALFKNNRIKCRRYLSLVIPTSEKSVAEYEGLYRISFDGTVIVSFGQKMYDGGEYADGSLKNVDTICSLAEKYCNKVLTIFNVPKGNTKVKNIIHEYSKNLFFVEIQDDQLNKADAETYLIHAAEHDHLTPDENLFARTEDDTFYGPAQLNRIYQDWMSRKMKFDIYPQYSFLVKSINLAAQAAPEGDAYKELSALIGLEEAKKFIYEAVNYYKAQRLFAERGLKRSKTAMHMVFTGNPGTAKTTIARLVARIMKDNKILSVGDLYEVGRGDLIEKYVGWTAKNIQAKFMRAKGSVLFIDEAYSLIDSKGGFGDEAINTMVQEMENHREDMIVILAGYPKEMEALLNKNPGLRSRIAFHLHFNDYSTEELYQITESLAHKAELTLDADVKPKLIPILEKARKNSDFGNGRYARNLLERAQMKQANRLMSSDVEKLTDKEITTLIADDFEEIATRQEKATIGFAG